MITKLQSIIGITKSELISVLLILSFGFVGLLIGSTTNNKSQNDYSDIYFRLDSLADINKSTFSGTDNFGNQYSTLEKGDTLVRKELVFGTKKSEKSDDKKLINKKVNLNTASKIELMKIHGIGEKTAVKIMEYRENNKFGKIEDIMNIRGIGEKKFKKMKDYIDI